MTKVGEDIVVLDVLQGTYFCLAGAARFIDLESDGAVTTTTVNARRALADARLLSEQAPQDRRPLPAAPRRATVLQLDTPPTLAERARFARTSFSVLRRYRASSFATLIGGAPAESIGRKLDHASSELVRHVALFSRWLPWIPYQETCLYRAFFLRQFLARSGLTADWVFGVSTWPFSAHCWLQFGDSVLDDDVDRVRSYHPIMVI